MFITWKANLPVYSDTVQKSTRPKIHFRLNTIITECLNKTFMDASCSLDLQWEWHRRVRKPGLGSIILCTQMWLLIKMCDAIESVSHYRRRGALTALLSLINMSPFSSIGTDLSSLSPTCAVINLHYAWTEIWARWRYLNVWWARGRERGVEVLTPFVLFLQSPPWSVLVHREGLRGRETGFIPHLLRTPATSDGSRTA